MTDGSCRLLLPLAFVKMDWIIWYVIFVQPCVNGTFRRKVWYAQPSCGQVGVCWQLQTVATPRIREDGLVYMVFNFCSNLR